MPSAAAAHAVLETSIPRSGAIVAAEPHVLTLVYDEDVLSRYARVDVVTTGGDDLAGPPHMTGSVVTVPLKPGRVGSYTVRWRMVASDDGHVTEGAYSFGVRAKPLPPAPVSGLSIPVAPQLFAWIQFLGIALAGGMLTFRAIFWVPAMRALADREPPDASLAIWVGVIGAALALHAGLLGFLAGAYPIVGGSLADLVSTEIEPIRVGTHLGQAWMVSTFAWLVVLALLVAAWVTPRKREPLLACAGLGGLAIAFGLSWASHPASRGGLALVADYAHLVAAALWVGGLVAVAIIVAAARSLSRSARETVARTSILRLSRLALPTVAVVALAGVYLALRELPTASALLSSGYGITLLVKGAVVVGAIALGAYHRRSVVPRLERGAPVASIRRTLVLELGLLLAVLAFAAILTQTAPPT